MGKILVAEDSLIVNQHIVHALKSGGHDAVSVYSGREAVDIALKHQPDLILMDIMMESQSDGIDAAFKIKDVIDLPIIFLTALTDEPTINKAKISLPYGYVVKPFNEAELLSNIDVALYKASAEKKIKENNELFQSIINSIDKAVFLLDSSDKIKYTNSIGEKITNQSFDVLMNAPIQNFLQFFDEDGERVDICSIEDYKNEGLYLKDREEIYGDGYTQIVELESVYRLFIFKDITEQVKVRKAKESLKTKRLSIFIDSLEKERERIARDLHDGVGQIANMIKLSVKLGDRGEGLVKMIDQFLEEMRKVTSGLSPLQFVDFPIDVCIKKIVEQANQASEINFSFQAQDVPNDLDLKYKVNLYRIVQENLSNIIKHSKAENASVQLYGFDDFIQMTIEDDGIGFKSGQCNDNDSYHGIQNMMLRAEVLRAECDLESNVGRGTFVVIKIPLHGKK